MKFPIYNVYREFFGYPRSSSLRRSLLFLFSIQEARKILKKACEEKTYFSFEEFENRLRRNALTLKLIQNAKKLIELIGIEHLTFYDAEITVDNQDLNLRSQNSFLVSTPYILDRKNKNIIFLTFGRPDNISKELMVFKSLTEHYKISHQIPESYENILYWDLTTGVVVQEKLNSLESVPLDELIFALKKLVKVKGNIS